MFGVFQDHVYEYLNVRSSLLFAALSLVFWYVYGYFQKGLYTIPGPFLGCLSDWYRIYHVVVGRRQDVVQLRMHAQYGDVVRYGPNLVMFANPDAIKDVYGIGKPLSKSPFYLPMQAMSNGRAFASLFTILENKPHAELKRTLATTFSGSSVVGLQPMVDSVVTSWIDQTRRIYVSGHKVCDAGWWLQLFAFDAVTSLTYSKTHGMVEQHSDVDGICAWLEGMFAYSAIAGQMPILDQFWNKNPVKRFLEWSGLWTPSFATVAFARKRIAERLAEGNNIVTKAKKPDLLTQLIESGQKHPHVLNQKMITAQATSIAFAGSDNTAITLTAILYYLLKNPDCYHRLVAELDEAAAMGNLDEIPTWDQTQRLTYFNACVKEAQRLHPSVGGLLERVTPPEGCYIMGLWYPGNTLVGVNAWILHHRPDVFGADHDTFHPERWLEQKSPEALARMNSCFFAFGAGSRICIGRSISLLEIGKLLPCMLRSFDVRLADPKQEWTLYNNFLVKQHGLHVVFSERQHPVGGKNKSRDPIVVFTTGDQEAVAEYMGHHSSPPAEAMKTANSLLL